MSICKGIAGARGSKPKGIFIHNDAGSQSANAKFYKGYLQRVNLENGFAHYYVADDGILQAEDDSHKAWHCGSGDGNANYLSVEVCQSMGDIHVFKANEEKVLQLVADKFKEYGLVPNDSTVKLHQEVSATACPHRSTEIHGGRAGCKQYFIQRIKELMGNTVVTDSETATNNDNSERKGETTMQCFYTVDGKGPVVYFDGREFHPLAHPDEMSILNSIYKENNGKDMPCFSWTSGAPWHARLQQAIKRVEK